MDTGSWVLLMLAAVVVCGYLGYLLGRRNTEQQEKLDRLEQELDEARGRAEQMKAGVNAHFEQSAVLFSQLARDYGAFLSHFQSSARDLGLSEGQTEDLLERAARPLLSHADGAAGAERPPSADAAAGETDDGNDSAPPNGAPVADRERAAADGPSDASADATQPVDWAAETDDDEAKSAGPPVAPAARPDGTSGEDGDARPATAAPRPTHESQADPTRH